MGLELSEEMVHDIIEWDVENWRHSLDYWLQQSTLNLLNSRGLEIGSRNGGLSLWLAHHGCNVICSDVNGPTELAMEKHIKYSLTNLIEYSSIDATELPYKNEEFDVIVFKSVLGGVGSNNNIEAQKKAIEEIHRVLKPGGELFFAENLSASPLHKTLRKKFVNWGNSWRYINLNELSEFCSIFSNVHYTTTGFFSTLGRNEKQRRLLAKFDQKLMNKITPNNWKYIVMGVAKK
ncbi:class I SAM-dependent methyltransferase [Bacillus sp. JJ1562]|uniref:class I SAM-dependent methyltransferase n=1 Tax=Bacillus sp. JJ1562 TaxID=3122960 RepID=UPI0030014A60